MVRGRDILWAISYKTLSKKRPGKTRASPTGRIAYHFPDMHGDRNSSQLCSSHGIAAKF